MKTIYPNETVKLSKGGRSSDKITKEEFKNLIKATYERLKKKDFEIEEYDWDVPQWIFYFNDYLPKLQKDLKYKFDFENVVTYPEKDCGFKDSDIRLTVGGTPYLQLYCGGDWEKGLIVYIYPSDNTLRAYIPTKGNNVRKDLKCVFGSEDELVGDWVMGVGFPDAEKDFLNYLRKYSTKEILDTDEIETEENPEWCLEDFETRLGER